MGEGEEFGAVGKFEVFVVGEVKFEFEEGGEFEELGAESGEFGGEVTTELGHGQLVSGSVGGGDEVSNGFGL